MPGNDVLVLSAVKQEMAINLLRLISDLVFKTRSEYLHVVLASMLTVDSLENQQETDKVNGKL